MATENNERKAQMLTITRIFYKRKRTVRVCCLLFREMLIVNSLNSSSQVTGETLTIFNEVFICAECRIPEDSYQTSFVGQGR